MTQKAKVHTIKSEMVENRGVKFFFRTHCILYIGLHLSCTIYLLWNDCTVAEIFLLLTYTQKIWWSISSEKEFRSLLTNLLTFIFLRIPLCQIWTFNESSIIISFPNSREIKLVFPARYANRWKLSVKLVFINIKMK